MTTKKFPRSIEEIRSEYRSYLRYMQIAGPLSIALWIITFTISPTRYAPPFALAAAISLGIAAKSFENRSIMRRRAKTFGYYDELVR